MSIRHLLQRLGNVSVSSSLVLSLLALQSQALSFHQTHASHEQIRSETLIERLLNQTPGHRGARRRSYPKEVLADMIGPGVMSHHPALECRNLKMGVIEDTANRETLAGLLRYQSSVSKDGLTSFAQYVERCVHKDTVRCWH